MIDGLSDRLKAMRQTYAYSLTEVANATGLSPAALSSFESGTRSPSVDSLAALADFYNCTADFLLGRTLNSGARIIDTDGLSDAQCRAVDELVGAMRINRYRWR